jgi:hypothetical protein
MKQKCEVSGCRGFHYIQPSEIGFLELCTDCDFKHLHHNRRIKQSPIEFKDRRCNS